MANDNSGNSRNPLDMTLDELIKANGTNSSQQRGRGRGRPPRGQRGGQRNQSSSAGRPVSRREQQPPRSNVRFNNRGPDLYRPALSESGTVKIYISNLSYKVDSKDIEELFSERGKVILKKSAVHYDAEGRSMGTAEVVFAKKKDATSAIQKYDRRLLDGRPLRLEIVDRETRNEFRRGGRVRGRSLLRGRGRRRRQAEDVDADGGITNTDMELDP